MLQPTRKMQYAIESKSVDGRQRADTELSKGFTVPLPEGYSPSAVNCIQTPTGILPRQGVEPGYSGVNLVCLRVSK